MQLTNSRRNRAIVAALIATFAAIELLRLTQVLPDNHTDFKIVWLGAKAILAGGDPYALTGPGKPYDFPWPPLYPATALIVAMPFALLSEHTAAAVFVWLSTFALAYGITSKGWYLLPIFASEAFFSSVHLAQWSIIMTAGLFIPSLQALVAVKPQSGLAVMAGAPSKRGLQAAVVAGASLTVASLLIVPGWPREWLALVYTADYIRAPILLFGGPLILLALLRWRRKEAWLLLSLGLIPHNLAWYDTLPLLTVARSFRESASLAIISTAGILAGSHIGVISRHYGATLIAATYLPALALVLLRPNEGGLRDR